MPDPVAVPALKRALRARIREARDAADPRLRAEWSASITDLLLELVDAARPRAVLSYVAFGTEFDTTAFNAALLARGIDLILPRMDRPAKRLALFGVRDPALDLVAGVWGILEPDPARCAPAAPSVVDWALIPGLAFDVSGGRLGYGAGFYDRLLPQLPPKTPRVAAAFAGQIVDEVPREAHDLAVDRVVTEAGTAPPPRD